ncbi:MAG: acyl-CoA thioesterase [Chloroflexi bacterium]|nr:acyl-CoA thioesterase [Chloroflexota bacterium]MCC6895002.1 acyl-CoA thioesterase [Anaerolineae bacterium]
MPATHIATFKVRHYECDAQGHLNNANYARYMEEAAFEASAAVGYDKARYDAMGFLWLAYETGIEYLHPVVYGDTLEVKTWVGDFRRVRSRRFYEFRKASDDTLVATANTDWVYLEAATERPTIVPPELIHAFAPEGITEPAPPRGKFPTPPPQPAGTFTLRRRVEWRDIDTAGHVNNAVYFNYIEDCGMQVANHFGWPLARSREAGWAAVAREHHIEYKHPALLDDELTISTWVAAATRASADRFYRITRPRDNLLLAQARTRWVWVDLQTGRPIRIPPDFLSDFATNIAQTDAAD